MTVQAALAILTGGYPQSANFNIRQFVGNLDIDGQLANLTAEELEAQYNAWQRAVDEM